MAELKFVLTDLRYLFSQQIPSSIFLFFIGLSASIVSMVFDKSDAGKSASIFLDAITSSLKQFNVFILVSLIFLFLSSLQRTFTAGTLEKFDTNKNSFLTGLSMRSIALNGLFSFLVPLISLILGMTFAMSTCLYANPELALDQKIAGKSIFGLIGSAFFLTSFLVIFYLISTSEDALNSKSFSVAINFVFLFLIVVSFFEIAK